jgi:alpha-galactosidase
MEMIMISRTLRMFCIGLCSVATLPAAWAAAPGNAIPVTELPARAVDDAIMAPAAEVQAMREWAAAAFQQTAAKPQFLGTAVPFSFQYAGGNSANLLKNWKRTVDTKNEKDCVRRTVTWLDPATGLEARAVVTAWSGYPAVEWLLYFKNTGTNDTPILENIQALDVQLAGSQPDPVLHQILGDSCSERSFLPQETALRPGNRMNLFPNGGRSSNGTFPFFNLQSGNRGLIVVVGWSGQWAAAIERRKDGPTCLVAGMEKTHLVLHPGEEIRTPRILLLAWKGDRLAAHNRFRRLMLFHYVQQQQDRPLRLPIAMQCFDRYFRKKEGWNTEAGQIAAARMTCRVGCDAHWLDAAWFELGFPDGVGNWQADPQTFPRGLRPVADACHRLGLQFILWYEPERVAEGSKIASEHPEFVFPGGKSRLFKLSDPAARRWLTDHLSRQIGEFGLDVYRNDFNIDPLNFWRGADAPNRQGITEIRYVEGLYAMWDELRANHPGLWIDNCASGGRRIDLETCMRSVPLWRSDTSCSPNRADWDQVQTLGLSLYVPLFTACSWTPDAYVVRSGATAGAVCQFDYLAADFPIERARAALAEVRANQKFWYGDFYPLTSASTAPDVWAAWQFHRPDLDAGIMLAFRRAKSNYPALQVSLRAVNPKLTYVVETIDESRQVSRKTLSGAELAAATELRLQAGSSLLMRYSVASK